MYPNIQVWLLLLIGSLCLPTIDAACPYKECSCGGARISCQNRGLTSMPQLLTGNSSTGYTVLNLDSNSITTILAGSLPPDLTEISFVHTPISHIDATAFDGSSSTLTKLSFTGANFTKIPDSFLHLNRLEHLTIYDSVIHDWNEAAMNHISQSIVTLFLQNVGLTVWPTWIKNYTQTVELSLTYSTITVLPDDALDNLTKINLLSIIHCQLTSIPKTISNLKSLQLLQLLQNNITDITWLPHTGYLTSLNLQTNSISDPVSFENALRPLADMLKYVNLQQNKFQVIPDLTFMTYLGSLDLSYNLISDTVSGAMPESLYTLLLTGNLFTSIPLIYSNLTSISYIQLGYNLIATIKDTDFPLWITEANLESNLITELTNTSFPENSSLVFLNLNSNPLSVVDSLAFINLLNLVHLNLQNTKLNRLPLSLSNLHGLMLLDARDSKDLVCTCLEKGLDPWIKGLKTVAGSCGVADIQDFFDTLSQSCPT